MTDRTTATDRACAPAPGIVAPLIASDPVSLRSELALFWESGADCAEIRADRYPRSEDEVAALIRSLRSGPRRAAVLLTLKGSAVSLLERFAAADDASPDWIDLDADDALRLGAERSSHARALRSRLILSVHDFEPGGLSAAPADLVTADLVPADLVTADHVHADLVSAALRAASALFPDAMWKIACTVRSAEEGEHFLSLLRILSAERAVIGVPMGEAGRQARLRAFEAGSLAAYGYLTVPNAPGQPAVSELLRVFKASDA